MLCLQSCCVPRWLTCPCDEHLGFLARGGLRFHDSPEALSARVSGRFLSPSRATFFVASASVQTSEFSCVLQGDAEPGVLMHSSSSVFFGLWVDGLHVDADEKDGVSWLSWHAAQHQSIANNHAGEKHRACQAHASRTWFAGRIWRVHPKPSAIRNRSRSNEKIQRPGRDESSLTRWSGPAASPSVGSRGRRLRVWEGRSLRESHAAERQLREGTGREGSGETESLETDSCGTIWCALFFLL